MDQFNRIYTSLILLLLFALPSFAFHEYGNGQIDGTFAVSGNTTTTGSITATGGFVGDLTGTSTTASYATTAGTATSATSADTATTASALSNNNISQFTNDSGYLTTAEGGGITTDNATALFYLRTDTVNTANIATTANNFDGSITASQVSDFDAEVTNNTEVAANTVHKTSTGADHSYIDQDVTSGSAPTLTGTNFSGTAGSLTVGIANSITSTADISHTELQDIGSNTHAQIDNHIGSVANPHSVSSNQVGKDEPIWNANELVSISVDVSGISAGEVLKYNGSSFVPSTDAGVGGGEANTLGTAGSGVTLNAAKDGVELNLKSLTAGTGISLAGTTDNVTITATGGAGSTVVTTGNLYLIASSTASDDTSIDFINLDSTFDTFVAKVYGITYEAPSNRDFIMRVSTDNGTNYLAGTEYWYFINTGSGTGVDETDRFEMTSLADGAGPTYNINGEVTMYNTQRTDLFPCILSTLQEQKDFGMLRYDGAATVYTSEIVNAIRFQADFGNINGKIELYGIATASMTIE
jgi:hypothetical protein